jgi:hypothetical protein
MKCTQNITSLHAHTCMYVQAGYFDHADRFGTLIFIYHINLTEFEQRTQRLVLHVLCAKIQTQVHVQARACIFRQNVIRSAYLRKVDYHPGKFEKLRISNFFLK